jgi:1-acyl-sn-glycerol-3-phosphate acyltransferase
VRDESLLRRWLRRALSFSLLAIAFVLAAALAPLALLLAALADLARPASPARRWPRVRAVLALLLVLTCEVLGLLAAFALFVAYLAHRSRARFVRHNAALQRAWTGALFRGPVHQYAMTVAVDGAAAADRAPFVLFIRHLSTVDTVLAAALIANPRKLLLRYVLKRELLWDPCLDVVGRRLPNLFVARDGSLRDRELAGVRALATGLGPRDGVLIYPEGTRVTPGKLARAVERLAGNPATDPALLERARRLRHVLPPRPGGPLALLEHEPALDVIIVAHTGLEGATSLADLWRGALIGSALRVRLERFPASDLPATAADRLRWLHDRWLDVDDWIEASRRPRAA